MTALAILLAVTAASCFAVSAALQYQSARQVRQHAALDPRLFGALVRRPRWLVSWAPDAAGTGLQAWALGVGAIALVQPILVSGLFLAIPLEAALNRRAPGRRELLAVAVATAGLAAFLVAANPRSGVDQPSQLAWLGIGFGTTVVVVACLVAARRATPTVRGTLLGTATGVLYGLVAALLKVCTARLDVGLRALVTGWYVYALVVVGLAGLLLNQNAFQSGPIAAPLTSLTLADPVFSVVVAVTAFHEQLSSTGPRLFVEVIAAAAMAFGIWLASTALESEAARPARPDRSSGELRPPE